MFNEIQSGLNNAFLDDRHDPYIDEDANSDDDLDAVLVSSSRRLIPGCDCQTTHSALGDSGTPDPHMILNRFNQTAGPKNLPTLSETELDEEGTADDRDESDSDEDETTDSLTDRRNGRCTLVNTSVNPVHPNKIVIFGLLCFCFFIHFNI